MLWLLYAFACVVAMAIWAPVMNVRHSWQAVLLMVTAPALAVVAAALCLIVLTPIAMFMTVRVALRRLMTVRH